MRTAAKQKELLKKNAQGITGPRAANADRFHMDPLCDNTLYRIDNTGRKVLTVRNHHFEIVDPYENAAQKKAEERTKNGGLTDAEINKARFYCAENEERILASLTSVPIVVPEGHVIGEVRRGAGGKAYTAVYELDDHGKPKDIAYYDDGFSCVRPDAAVLGATVSTELPTELNGLTVGMPAYAPPAFGSAANPLITTSLSPSMAFGGPSGDPKQKLVPPAPFLAANAPRFELR